MRVASCGVQRGDTGPWKGPSGGQSYRYADQPRSVLREQLYSDLIRLAKSGATLYAEMARHLTSSVEESFELADLMRTPGFCRSQAKSPRPRLCPQRCFMISRLASIPPRTSLRSVMHSDRRWSPRSRSISVPVFGKLSFL